MKLNKLIVFKKIVETEKINPISPLFQEKVKAELLKSVAAEVHLNFVSPESLKLINQPAQSRTGSFVSK